MTAGEGRDEVVSFTIKVRMSVRLLLAHRDDLHLVIQPVDLPTAPGKMTVVDCHGNVLPSMFLTWESLPTEVPW